MRLCWYIAQKMLDEISITKLGWNTRDKDRGTSTYDIGAISDYRAGNDTVAQEVA